MRIIILLIVSGVLPCRGPSNQECRTPHSKRCSLLLYKRLLVSLRFIGRPGVPDREGPVEPRELTVATEW